MDCRWSVKVCEVYCALHVSWVATVCLTVLPMVVHVPRSYAFLYLIVYGMANAWVVMCAVGFAKNPFFQDLLMQQKPDAVIIPNLLSKMDEKVYIFRKIKLQAL